MSSALTSYSFPTTILFGRGSLSELTGRLPQIKIQRPLVVTDPGLLPTEAFQLLKKTLGADRQGRDCCVLGCQSEPDRPTLLMAQRLSRQPCDGVIAFGGGSALDVGWAIRLLLKNQLGWMISNLKTTGTVGPVFAYLPPHRQGMESSVLLASTRRKPSFSSELLVGDSGCGTDARSAAQTDRATGLMLDALHRIVYLTGVSSVLRQDRLEESIIVDALPRTTETEMTSTRGKMLVAASMGAWLSKDLGATHFPSPSVVQRLQDAPRHGQCGCLSAVMRFNARRKPLYRRVGLAGLDVVRVKDEKPTR
jgi:alcohol dehydrogenase class IV